uniref:RNA helicase n=1 Tax=Chaetoceros debilis TaxID=122233 RepID=A0A7S3V9E8_9STRA
MSNENTNRKKSKTGSGGGFQSLGLSDEVYRGVVKMGFRMPTPVQRKSLPVALSGSDTVCMARTGSGKTAAFCIPLLERLLSSQRRKQQEEQQDNRHGTHFSAGAVILSPTRELSLQTLRVMQTLSQYIEAPKMRVIGINGGESMEKQFALLSSNPDIIVATPGRLAHHLSEIPDFDLKHCEMVVFDEADRLFEMGFAMQIREICSSMPGSESGRQTMLFSATMPRVLVEFTKSGIMDRDPQVVRLDKDATVSENLRTAFVTVRSQEKDGALLHLLRDILPTAKMIHREENEDDRESSGRSTSSLGLTLIFAATRHHVDYLTMLINNAGIEVGHNSRADGSEFENPLAICIYGSMDQEARKENLYSFRKGRSPIMVVTDVAARGIDIPLIDHVIHYSFPPTAKLYVHRSGRAARAGRIGYCWGLVDTEEMPYMVDLHLFLGRKLTTGHEKKKITSEEAEKGKSSTDVDEELMYSVNDLTPEMVHYGSIPESTSSQEIENVRRIIDSELTGSHDAETLRSLVWACRNAMKQYRRSRPEASRQGVRRSKAILEGEKDTSTGQRKGGGMIDAHPILRKAEVDRIMSTESRKTGKDGNSSTSKADIEKATASAKTKLHELKQREDMLRAMSKFRPKETVFEAFATGGGKALGVMSQVDKGRTCGVTGKKNDGSAAYSAMKSMRRQMKLAHDKGTSMVVAGSDKALVLNGDENLIVAVDDGGSDSETSEPVATDKSITKSKKRKVALIVPKQRMSKAERKRLKKKGKNGGSSAPQDNNNTQRVKNKRGSDFRDASFYIDNNIVMNSKETQRSQHIEAAMQPSAADGRDGMNSALRLEEAMLDIVGDENADMVKKHRVMRWDKSKGNYVQTTLGMETSGMSKTRKMKLESGQTVKSDKAKLGELYQKWQKKTNKSIGRVGVFDDVIENDASTIDAAGYARKTPIVKSTDKNKSKTQDDVQTASQIRKKREATKNNKIRQMSKKDRGAMFAGKRAERNNMAAKAGASGQGWQGKKGFSGRYGVIIKGKNPTKNL